MISLNKTAQELGTFIVNASFRDEDGVATAPTTLKWTLFGRGNVVINGKEDQVIASPGASNDVLLSGLDLALADGVDRWILFSATYSSSLGSNLPTFEVGHFQVKNVIGIGV